MEPARPQWVVCRPPHFVHFHLTQNIFPCILSTQHSSTWVTGGVVAQSGCWIMTTTAKIPDNGRLAGRSVPAFWHAIPGRGSVRSGRPRCAKQTQLARPCVYTNYLSYNKVSAIWPDVPLRKTKPNKANSRADWAGPRTCRGLSSAEWVAVPRKRVSRLRQGLRSGCSSRDRESLVGRLSVLGESLGRTHSPEDGGVFQGCHNDLVEWRLCRQTSQDCDNMSILALRLL